MLELLEAKSCDVQKQHQSTATILLDIVVGCVMRYVTVNQPFTRLPGRPDHVVTLSGPDVDGVGLVPGALL